MVSDGVGRVLNDDGLTPTRQSVVARDVLGFDQDQYFECRLGEVWVMHVPYAVL